jgi:hypothetical protein
MEHSRTNALLAELAQFTGTQGYTRITRRHLLTDGARYLADHAECYWLVDAVASHLDEIGTQDWFVSIRLELQGIWSCPF